MILRMRHTGLRRPYRVGLWHWWVLITFGVTCFLYLLGVLASLASPGPSGVLPRVLLLVALTAGWVPIGLGSWRAWNLGVWAGPQGVVLTQWFRSTLIEWEDIDGFLVAGIGGMSPVAIANGESAHLQVRLRDGSVRDIHEVSRFIGWPASTPAQVALALEGCRTTYQR